MKKLLCTSLFLFIFIGQVLGQEKNADSDKPDFRKVKWGMNKDAVKNAETAKLQSEDDNYLGYEISLAGLNSALIYQFKSEKLVRSVYAIKEKHTNKTDHIADYERLKPLLTKKYGTPIIDDISWKNDLYKDDPSKWGFAISMGHLVYVCQWENEDTSIFMILHGDNYNISHGIQYEAKEFENLIKQSDEKEALDEL